MGCWRVLKIPDAVWAPDLDPSRALPSFQRNCAPAKDHEILEKSRGYYGLESCTPTQKGRGKRKSRSGVSPGTCVSISTLPATR